MPTLDTLLIELATEDLPAVTLSQYSNAFCDSIVSRLNHMGFSFNKTVPIATPRRLGILIHDIADHLEDKEETKIGPSVSIAYKDDAPTKAAVGWCRSNGVELSDVMQVDGPKGKSIAAKVRIPGAVLDEVLEGVITQAIKDIPIAKRMRWSDVEFEFIRPVTGLCVMHGTRVLPLTQFGFSSSSSITGHRFHTSSSVSIDHAGDYPEALKSAYVIPTINERKQLIADEVKRCCQSINATAFYEETLLEEIACLVEYPKVLVGEFDKSFLSVPKEALIQTMKGDQKYIPLIDTNGALINRFIFVSNIDSKYPHHVIEGNQRVIHPRLSDAQFFFQQDRGSSLADKAKQLDRIAFQEQLGSLGDKVRRVVHISTSLAKIFAESQVDEIIDTAKLCKADLCSKMVYEFPEVQGVMGKYYAQHDGFNERVAQGIEEHYLPKFSGDQLPTGIAGALVGIADRLDTLVGIFAADKAPRGDKDPFALRRAAIGLLRILLAFDINLKLSDLLTFAADAFQSQAIKTSHVVGDCEAFIVERMVPLFQDKGFSADLVNAVLNVNAASPTTSLMSLNALNDYINSGKLTPIIALNKRVNNILSKQSCSVTVPDGDLAESAQESALLETCLQFEKGVEGMAIHEQLDAIQGFTGPLENFFENVMVMVEDSQLRSNRLAILSSVQRCFRSVADFSVITHR